MSKQASAEDDISCSRKINCCILLKDKQSDIQIPIVIKFPYNARFDWLKGAQSRLNGLKSLAKLFKFRRL